jgi:MtrB/PioB family decaheme-associated outer membrane protein
MRATVPIVPSLTAAIAAVLALAVATPASAQWDLGGGWSLEGDAEAGVRFFPDKPPQDRRAKWEEYRDFPGDPGLPYLERLHLRIFRADESYSAEFGGSKWGQTDQEFFLRAERLGLWQAGFDWNQTPHILSTNAQLLASQPFVGVFALPNPRPNLTAYNDAPTLDEVGLRWDTAKMFFKLSPTPEMDITAQYERIFKHGDRPFGVALGSPGSNFYEVLEPIDQTIHDFRIRGTWAMERWQLQFGYTLSVFENNQNRVKADNPCFGLTAPLSAGGCGPDASAPQTGQMSLAPSNIANTLTLGGGVSLPMRTRLSGNFSWTLLTQNTEFLPHTINQNLLAVDPTGLALPQSDLNGFVQTFLLNLNATSRPFRDWTFTAKYRLYDMIDSSDEISFPALVLNDRSISPGRIAGRWDYVRQNAGVDARWQLIAPVALTVGGGWESWLRNKHREVHNSNEAFAKAAVDATPFEWLLARLTYRAGFRRIGEYDTRAHAEHAVVEEEEEPTNQGQSVLLRKYDESNRNTQGVDLFLQISPIESLTITPNGSYQWIDYLSPSPPAVDPAGGRSNFLGAQEATNWTVGADISWNPMERLRMSAGYVHESGYKKMRSRSRPVVGAFALDFTDFDWITNITDTIDTVYAGIDISLIPKVLDASFSGSYAYALSTYLNRNPVAPTSGSAAQNATAKAQRFPAFEDELIRLETALRYHFLKNWTAKLGYVFESWQKHDWRTDQLNPFIPGVTSIWLGNDLRNYTAHIIAASIGYRFR